MKYLKAKLVIVFVTTAILSGNAYSYPQNVQRPLTGPWEISIQSGHSHDSKSIGFDIPIADENKAGKLNSTLPVLGKPLKIQLEEYLPDLQWETKITPQKGAGVIAEIEIIGSNYYNKMQLDSNDPDRNSIKASIGSVAVKKVYSKGLTGKIAAQIDNPEVLGIISVWVKDSNTPHEFVIDISKTISIPDTDYKINAIEYVPHYSVDTDTRKVTTLSDKPVNPAIKIEVQNNEETVEQWLWANFPSYPHSGHDLPIRIEYSTFKPTSEGDYIIAGSANDSDLYLFYVEDEKPKAKKAITGENHLFKTKDYSFNLTGLHKEATVSNRWINKSDSLKNPAVIATLIEDGKTQQAVLELNKPYNAKTDGGVLSVLFRQKQNHQSIEHLSN